MTTPLCFVLMPLGQKPDDLQDHRLRHRLCRTDRTRHPGGRYAALACRQGDGRGPQPFDVALLRGLPCRLGTDGKPSQAVPDTPVYHLVENFPDL